MNIIRKIISPTKQHHEPYLTLWIADLEQGKQIWVQNSEDIEKPLWERYGDIVERRMLQQENFYIDI